MRKATVEPIVFLFMFTIYLWYPLSTELIYENVLGSPNRDCEDNDTQCEDKKDAAQEETSRLQNYIAVSRHVPAFFSAIVLGPFTDRYGRRPALVLSCIGNGIWTTVLLLNVYFKFSVYYFLIGGTIDGLCGGVSTFLFASFAYIADTSTDEERTNKIALTESMIFLGGFIASVAGGMWSDKRGFAAPLFTVLICYVIIVLYICFRLPEPRKVSSLRSYKLSDHIRRTCNVLFAPTGGRESLWLSLAIFTILIAVFAGTNNIFVLFLLDQPFNWSNTGIGYFIALNTLLNGGVTLFALPKFNKSFGDFWTAFLGVVAAMIGSVIVGISTAAWMLYFGSAVGAVGSMSIPTLRSGMSKMISPNCQGSLFSLMSAAEILCVLVSSSTMSKIYEATHDYYHGFCFLIEAGLAFIAIGLLASHKIFKAKQKPDKEELIVVEDETDETVPPSYMMTDMMSDLEEDTMTDNIKIKPQLTLHTSQPSPPCTQFSPTTSREASTSRQPEPHDVTSRHPQPSDVTSRHPQPRDVTSRHPQPPATSSEGAAESLDSLYDEEFYTIALDGSKPQCGHVTCSNMCSTAV